MRNGQTNICFSGGAKGSDLAWGDAALAAGHQVIHFSFEGHRTHAPQSTLYVMSMEELQQADEHLKVANQSLKRYLPFQKPWIINLLRRNYYQIRDTHSLYAISSFDKKGQVNGGTAWAIQMFFDKLKCEEKKLDEFPIYCYSQVTNFWMQLTNQGWIKLPGTPSTPKGLWTGVGTRDLIESGAFAIKSVFGRP